MLEVKSDINMNIIIVNNANFKHVLKVDEIKNNEQISNIIFEEPSIVIVNGVWLKKVLRIELVKEKKWSVLNFFSTEKIATYSLNGAIKIEKNSQYNISTYSITESLRGMSFKNFIQENDIIKLITRGKKVIIIDPKNDISK